MVRRILKNLSISPLDTAFVDNDPFERDSIAVQEPGISAWSHRSCRITWRSIPHPSPKRAPAPGVPGATSPLRDESAASEYVEFLRRCDIRLRIRPFVPKDFDRAKELLARTHRMNLGVLSLDEAVGRLERASEGSVVIAEMSDNYGDMGRCAGSEICPAGTEPLEQPSRAWRSLAGPGARGLALSRMLGLLRHPNATLLQTRRCLLCLQWLESPVENASNGGRFQK